MTAVDTHLLLRALFDELARCGMRTAATAAGSRNTPIIEAAVNEPRIRPWSHIDERSAGFFAVGAARAAGLPVAITTTSGTAVANLLPAVVEASEARLPLIVLSADRPAELRQIGAGQTIDQVKLFGPYVRFFAELDLYEATSERMRWVRALACRAYWTAWDGAEPGPVHLNIPLREPLITDRSLPADPAGGEGRPEGQPWVASQPSRPATPEGARDVLPRTLVVAGATTPEVADAVVRFCGRHGFPLLADPLSGARRGPAAIAHYDLLLRDPRFGAARRPAMVLRIGDLPTSKPLRTWLAGLDAVQISFGPHRAWADPGSVIAGSFAADPADFFDEATLAGARDPGWLDGWRAADVAVAAAIENTLGPELSEPRLAQLLTAELPPDVTLFVASSMPIRDVEEFASVRDAPPRVLANRGANGIDGTVSSAFGAAATAAGDEQIVLLIGDVTLAHDIGGLLTHRRAGLKLTIVLINNDGGGIFHFLPIATAEHATAAAFAEHIATPHGLDFAHAAALYGFDHVTPTDVGGFMAALNRALTHDASTIIEVRTDRAANRQLHADVAGAAARALAGPDQPTGGTG